MQDKHNSRHEKIIISRSLYEAALQNMQLQSVRTLSLGPIRAHKSTTEGCR